MAENIVSKGFYEHPGIPDFVSAKQYIIMKKGRENRLFFRFENPKNDALTAISFTVDCYNGDGKIIKSDKITQSSMTVNGHSCFVVSRPVVLPLGSVDFKVTVNSATYGNYCYVTHGNDVEAIFVGKKKSGDVDRTPFLHKLGGQTHVSVSKAINTSRFFSILVAAILISLFALLGIKIYDFTSTETIFTLDQVDYTFATNNRKNGPIVIVGIKSNARNIIVPDEIEGHDVLAVESYAFSDSKVKSVEFQGEIEIRDSAFSNASRLSSVHINSAESIGQNAFFNCRNLTKVTVNGGLKTIGQSAFEGCTSLAEISLPDTVRSVQSYAFYNCKSLRSLTIPDSAVSIGANILHQCSSLEYLKVPYIGKSINETTDLGYFFTSTTPASLKTLVVTQMDEISRYMFSEESHLKSITFSTPVTYVGDYAFSLCTSLESFEFTDKAEYIGEGVFERCTSLKKVTLPSGITKISDFLFFGCYSLESVVIPSTVTEIGESAFKNCQSLSSLEIPASVSLIGTDAILGCTGIKTLTLPFLGSSADSSATLASMLSSPFYCSLENLTLLSGEVLPDNAFADFGTLTTVSLPHNVRTIGANSFGSCYSLTNITIPETVTDIGEYAFYQCSALQSVDIPKNVTNAAAYSFAECSSLTSAVFRNSNTSIGEAAFMNCYSLSNLILPGSLSSLPVRICEGCSSLQTVTIPGAVTVIPDYAFYGCTSLETVHRPSSLTAIGNYAFSGCSALASFEFPTTMRSIGNGAFSQCTSLSSMTIPKAVTSVGQYVLDGCSSLESLIAPFPSNYSSEATFNYYFASNSIPSSLKFVTISSVSNLCLPNNAFLDCHGIVELNIPENITSIGRNAFKNCYSLKSLVIPDSITNMGTGMLIGTNALESIIIPYAGTSASSSAQPFREFYLNDYYSYEMPSALTTVTLTKATFIPACSFSGMTSIRRINLPSTLTSIETEAFYGCSALNELTIPASVRSINSWAFEECIRLYEVTNLSSASGSFPYALRVFTSEAEKASNKTVVGSFSFIRAADGSWYLTSYDHKSTSHTLPSNTYFDAAIIKYVVPQYLFYGDSLLSSIKISADVTKISSYAFMGCHSLSTVTSEYTYSFTEICDSAFSDAPISTLQIPSSTVTIGSYAFSNTGITSLTVPASVTFIGDGAFAYCSALESITFERNSKLSAINESSFCNTSVKSLAIPKSVRTIGNSAFAYCNSLNTLTIESGSCLESIGTYAFTNSSITGISLPDTLTSIGAYAFSACSALQSISFGVNSRLSVIEEYAFDNTAISAISLPGTLTVIGNNAFANTKISSLTIPRALTSLGCSAFENCSSLQSLTFEGAGSLQTVGAYSFYRCTSLTSISFGTNSSISLIDNYAFYAAAISTLDLPATVTSIGSSAFAQCENLSSVTFRSKPNIVSDAFFNSNNILEVYNLAGLSLSIGSTAHGGVATNAIIIHTNAAAERLHDVNTNGFAFKKSDDNWFLMGLSENNNPKELILDSFTYQGSSVNSFVIYKNAFYSNKTITNVTIGSAVADIMPYAFYNCSSITSVTFEADSKLTKIQEHAFAYCSGIKELILPDSIKEIGQYAFYNCTALEVVLLPKSLTYIGYDAFYYCYKLYDVMNMSTSLSITKGETGNGYVGCYALAVRKSSTPLAVTTITTSSSAARFVKYSNVWYLIDVTPTASYSELEIPKLTVNNTSYSYRIFGKALSSISSQRVIIPETVLSIDADSLTYLGACAVLFCGSRSEWASLDKYGSVQSVYAYVDCVHEYGTWTYDTDGSIVTTPAATTVTTTKEPTCSEEGSQQSVCSKCNKAQTLEIPPTGIHTIQNDKCTGCGISVQTVTITVTSSNFNELGFISNDSAYPFYFTTNGAIASSNKNDRTTSVLCITAEYDMTISFNYRTSSEQNYDFFTIRLNGQEMLQSSGVNSSTPYTITLKAGDVLSLEYSKDYSGAKGDDCVYITEMTIETKQVVSPKT